MRRMTPATRLKHWSGGWLYRLGISSGDCTTIPGKGPVTYTMRFRGKRYYVLGWQRGKWRCLLRFHHWPTKHQPAFDFCGKCVPWLCCGSIEWGHAEGCEEDQ